MSEVVLGLNAYHGDASAALFVDGSCVAAVEEERFTRRKQQAGFPANSVRWCLEHAGLEAEDLDHIAIGRNPATNLQRKALLVLQHPPGLGFLRSRLRNGAHHLDVRSELAEALEVAPEDFRAKLHRVEHHRSHMASAFFCSPFEEAACVSLDGMGDFVSTMWGRGQGSRLKVQGAVTHPHSLGHFYQALTHFLGLPGSGDEYKLMGLAAYGEPVLKDKVHRLLSLRSGLQFRLALEYFVHHTRGVDLTWEHGTPQLSALWSERMVEEFGPCRWPGDEVTQRDQDLAASTQAVLEEVGLEMLRRLHDLSGSSRLIMAGSVALNCVLNGRILPETPFDEVWVQPASNDAGIAIGAALWVIHQVLERPRSWMMTDAFLGPRFDDHACERALSEAGLSYVQMEEHDMAERVASRVADGAIVGWFQGAMEFGPRALGNRSIVCDARKSEMRKALNARVKRREGFRPFAPSILAERTGDWFEQDYPSPFMTMAYEIKSAKRPLIPAVTHVDGTGRLQTVERSTNPRYHSLIKAYERRTGVPVVLNTSFNENEPICCTPEQAVDCFSRTPMDVLVLGDFLVDRAATADA
jgi:carbamoyltransferase